MARENGKLEKIGKRVKCLTSFLESLYRPGDLLGAREGVHGQGRRGGHIETFEGGF